MARSASRATRFDGWRDVGIDAKPSWQLKASPMVPRLARSVNSTRIRSGAWLEIILVSLNCADEGKNQIIFCWQMAGLSLLELGL